MATQRLEMHRTLGLAMGTLNTCIVMVVIVLSLHVSDELADLLGGLSTAVGLSVFALLWTTTTYCTHKGWLETAPRGDLSRIGSRYFGPSVVWGAMSGGLFFGVLLTAYVIATVTFAIANGEPQSILFVWLFAFFAAFIGGIVAGAIGMTAGFILATVDILLAKLVLAMLRPALTL